MSITSMTAFGSGVSLSEDVSATAEIKTLNSRFIEVNVRLPRGFQDLEIALIKLVRAGLKRGKVDITVDIQKQDITSKLPSFDLATLKHYKALSSQISDIWKSLDDDGNKPVALSLFELMRLEGIMIPPSTRQNYDKNERCLIENAVSTALEEVKKNRLKEGRALGVALKKLIMILQTHKTSIVELMSQVRLNLETNYKRKLDKIVSDLGNKGFKADLPPEERIAGELAVLLDKVDIEEELTRLDTHCSTFKDLLDQEGSGRKLDFLCQELHREVNTISSKLNNIEVTDITLDMKQTVERIRQQIQNIE